MKLRLLSKKPEIENVTTFLFEPETPISWKAGQYLRYKIENHHSDERGETRFFTIASAPYQNFIQITTRINPDGSTFKKDLANLKVGGEIFATGPGGNFTIDDHTLNYVFIAGGIGITPFYSMILDLNYRNLPINITLLYANKTNAIVFQTELEAIAQKHAEFKIQYFIGDHHIDESTLQPLTSTPHPPLFYISGPEPMMQTFVNSLTKLGVPDDNIKHDYFPGYEGI